MWHHQFPLNFEVSEMNFSKTIITLGCLKVQYSSFGIQSNRHRAVPDYWIYLIRFRQIVILHGRYGETCIYYKFETKWLTLEWILGFFGDRYWLKSRFVFILIGFWTDSYIFLQWVNKNYFKKDEKEKEVHYSFSGIQYFGKPTKFIFTKCVTVLKLD